MTFLSTKTFGHELGLSCAFRQWRANHSHCQYLHGYALSIRFTFEALTLDDRNWVMDFGGLKQLKAILQNLFDHKTVVAADDPLLDYFQHGDKIGLLDLVVVPHVGCEKFAEHIYQLSADWLSHNHYSPRCKLISVEVKEHGANSAIYQP